MKRNYKKLLIAGLTASFMVALVGCGGKSTATDDVSMTTEEVSTTEDVTTEDITTEEAATTETVTTEIEKATTTEKKTSEKKTDNKKKDTTSKKTTASKTESASTNTSNTNGSSTSNTSTTTSHTTTPSNNTTTTTTTTTECQHNWVAVTHTVHHDAVMGERIVESAVVADWYCNNCQKYYISVNDDPCNGANGSDADYVLKPAVRETYEVSPAYDETVTDYYKCSKCGIRR